jgi:hypothetical protein
VHRIYISKPFAYGGRPGMSDKTTERGRISRRAAIKVTLKTSAYVAPAVASIAYARGVAAATPASTSVSIVGVCTLTPSHYFYNTTVSNFAIAGAPPNAQVNLHVEIFYTLGDSSFIDVPVTVDATGTALFTSTLLMIPRTWRRVRSNRSPSGRRGKGTNMRSSLSPVRRLPLPGPRTVSSFPTSHKSPISVWFPPASCPVTASGVRVSR